MEWLNEWAPWVGVGAFGWLVGWYLRGIDRKQWREWNERAARRQAVELEMFGAAAQMVNATENPAHTTHPTVQEARDRLFRAMQDYVEVRGWPNYRTLDRVMEGRN